MKGHWAVLFVVGLLGCIKGCASSAGTSEPGQVVGETDRELLDRLRRRGALPADAHARITAAVVAAEAWPTTSHMTAIRDRRQSSCTPIEAKCTNVDEDVVVKALAQLYGANMLAGLTWFGIISIILLIAWFSMGLKEQFAGLKAIQNEADADGDGKVSLEEMLGYTAKKAQPILGEGGAITDVLEIAEKAGNMDADGDGHVSAAEALAFAQKLKAEAEPMMARARAGSINPEAQQAVQAMDKMLNIATGSAGQPTSKDAAEVALAAAGSQAGVEVTVEEAFSFAQHMSSEGRKIIERAQRAEHGSIDSEALKTFSLIDSAIQSAKEAEVTEFARSRTNTTSATRSGTYVEPRVIGHNQDNAGSRRHETSPVGAARARAVAKARASEKKIDPDIAAAAIKVNVVEEEDPKAATVVNPAADTQADPQSTSA